MGNGIGVTNTYSPNGTTITQSVCPWCGRCPCCGRPYPWMVPFVPYAPNPYIVYTVC